MGRRKKLINNTDIPQHTIESIARRLLPDIMAYYQSEEAQREFAEWKTEQEKLKTTKDNNSGKSVYQSKPPVKLVVCTSPKRAYYRPASQDALNGPPIALLLQAAAKAACFYAFVFLSPVNGS